MHSLLTLIGSVAYQVVMPYFVIALWINDLLNFWQNSLNIYVYITYLISRATQRSVRFAVFLSFFGGGGFCIIVL